MQKLIKELESISKKMEEITKASELALDSVAFWKNRTEIFFDETEGMDEEVDLEDVESLTKATDEASFLIRRVDIELAVLEKLDKEHKELEKRKAQILKILKA